eukprot:Gregarina_sp_Poly_1__8201@NODE_475_length_8096_cov_496_560966_g384_i0_p4_GENE_NODE_475_length_8096_cov_496_560966_g384_i0NODE_475_length_8096_cov_496_560966_g384_i0_p4_ORF_typecomplete_len281_score44_62Aldose_epim/PF01263_20/5_2e19Pepdidase_M14_N/PF18027_1/0_012_NODE_475_length_8096_cov_496_560966_g384_i017842626
MSFELNSFDSEHIFTVGKTEVKVIPNKCLVSGFKVGDWEILYRPLKTKNVFRAGLPLMIPNFSSLRKDEHGNKTFIETGTILPHHGFGRTKDWTVEQPRQDGISLYMEPDEETMKMYPFKWRFHVNVTVSEGQLKHEVTITNMEESKNLPIQPGLHPYFNCMVEDKPNLKVDFEGFKVADWDWKTKETCPDYPVPFNHKASVEFPKKGKLEFIEEPDNGTYHYTQMQIWCDPAGAPDHDFICFEPVTYAADGLNNPKTRLNIPPKGTAKLTMILKATPLA